MREDVWAPSARFVGRFSRVLAASAAMAAVLIPASVFYSDLSRILMAKEIAVIAVVCAGGLVYGVCIVLFRAVSVSELKATLKREPGATASTGLD